MAKYVNEFPQHFDGDGNPLAFYKVFFGEPNKDPKSFPKDIYSNRTLISTLPATQTLNDSGSYQQDIYLSESYSIRVETPLGALWRESPEITGINTIFFFDGQTKVAMVASPDIALGDFVTTVGFNASGDGGDNVYEAVANTGGPYNEFSLIDSTGNPAIEFVGLFPGGIHNPLQGGATVGITPSELSANTTILNLITATFPDVVVIIPSGVGYYLDLLTVNSTRRFIDISQASHNSISGLPVINLDVMHLLRHLSVNGDINLYNTSGNPEITFGGAAGYLDDRFLIAYNTTSNIFLLKFLDGSDVAQDVLQIDSKTNDPKPRWKHDLRVDRVSSNPGYLWTENGSDRVLMDYAVSSNDLLIRLRNAADSAYVTAITISGEVNVPLIKFNNIPTFADDAAAGVGGLVVDQIYKTAAGELRIKV